MRLCPLCGGTAEATGHRYSAFSQREFHYGVCRACDLGLVLDPRTDYGNIYDEAYYRGAGADPTVDYLAEMHDPETIRTLEWRGLSRSLGPVDPNTRVLDFGSGLGGLARWLSREGWKAVGYEDPGFARDWMKANDVPIVDDIAPAAYDVIFAVEVMEHVVDPVAVLHRLRDGLRPGGRLIITTGNTAKARQPLERWSYSSVPEVHVTFWSPRSWAVALRAAAMQPVAPAHRLSTEVTQYKVVKRLPQRARVLARLAPVWRPAAVVVDRRFGVSDFSDGLRPREAVADSGGSLFRGLSAPPGQSSVPAFDHGWRDDAGTPAPFLTYVHFDGSSWSDDLEEIHEESSRDHFMDVLTRRSLLAAITDSTPPDGVVADLGCSTGYLLEDLEQEYPRAQLVGVDVVGAGLRKAHAQTPQAALLLADVCDLPIGDGTVDAVVSANMLEHVADDVQALREINRILVPGGVAALVVPFGHNLYDYYDRFLGHERRYAPSELSGKAVRAGLRVTHVGHLGQLLYPPFWLVKKRNRLLRDGLTGEALRARVEQDIAGSTNSRLGTLACRIEQGLGRRGLRVPVGIRELVVLRKPASPAS